MLTFYLSRIPDPGVKKAPDPGSGSETLGEDQEPDPDAPEAHVFGPSGSMVRGTDPAPDQARDRSLSS